VLSGFGRGMLGPAPAAAATVPAAAAVLGLLAWDEGNNGSEELSEKNALTLVVVVVIAVLLDVLLLLLKVLMVAIEVGGRFKLLTSNGLLEVIEAMGVAAVTGGTGATVVGGTLVVDGDDGSATMVAGATMEDVLGAAAVRGTGCSVIGSAFGAVMAGVEILVGITGGATVGAIVENIAGNESVGIEVSVAAVMRGLRVAVTGRAAIAGVGGN